VIDALNDRVSIQSQLREIHRNLKPDLPSIQRIAVAIYDEKSDTLNTFVHSTEGESPFSHYEAKLRDVPSLQALSQTGAPRIINNLQTFQQHTSMHVDRLLQTGFRSSYTVPFYDHNRFFGLLFFDSREPGYFSEAVVRHLALHAHLISLLIINEVSRVSALRSAIDVARTMSQTHNEETGAHLDRMARYARLIAKTLADRDPNDPIDDEFVEFVFLYAPLHDVGKIAVPDRILLKPAKLSDAEFAIMKRHVAAGMEIVESIASGFHVGSGQHVEVLRNIVRYHHESWDGSGYLAGRKGTEIPLEARIVSVADVFDALTTERCYKRAWPNSQAIALMQSLAGTRFDPDCVAALIANLGEIVTIQAQFRSHSPFHEGYMRDL
jgi:HD-GYP domain-containing protein (c-di-GMP phosphodiesterase class II)